jgi:hypothetical protein
MAVSTECARTGKLCGTKVTGAKMSEAYAKCKYMGSHVGSALTCTNMHFFAPKNCVLGHNDTILHQ